MILIVDMNQPEQYDSVGGHFALKRQFEKAAGHPCLVVNYPDASIDFVERYGVRAIFITGTGYDWGGVDVSKLHNVSDLMRQTTVPTYGACGGHQLLGFIFNNDLRKVKRLADEPIRKLKPGEPDWFDTYRPGFFKEKGIHTIEIVKRDPLFAGLPGKMRLPEAHYCEIKKLPPDFVLLATGKTCRIQAMRHKDRPIYGCQFHAEAWTKAYAHGKRIMENFFRIAGLGVRGDEPRWVDVQ